jgi:hypothetical protein
MSGEPPRARLDDMNAIDLVQVIFVVIGIPAILAAATIELWRN